MMITHTISVPELLWTLWCIPGLGFLSRLLWKAFGDWRFIVKNGINGMREYEAVNVILIFSAMTITNFVFVIAGIIAMILPPPVHNSVAPLTYALTALFMLASIAKSIFAWIISARYDNLIERIEDGSWHLVVTNKESAQ